MIPAPFTPQQMREMAEAIFVKSWTHEDKRTVAQMLRFAADALDAIQHRVSGGTVCAWCGMSVCKPGCPQINPIGGDY